MTVLLALAVCGIIGALTKTWSPTIVAAAPYDPDLARRVREDWERHMAREKYAAELPAKLEACKAAMEADPKWQAIVDGIERRGGTKKDVLLARTKYTRSGAR